jgi:hypothetical protein
MEVFIFWEVIVAVFIFVVTALLDSRARKRAEKARALIEASSFSKAVKGKFLLVADSAYKKGIAQYWLTLTVFIAVCVVGFQIYATAVEPGVIIFSWIIINLMVYGIVLLAIAISLSFLVGRATQHAMMTRFLDQQKQQKAVLEARSLLAFRVGEIGGSVISVIAMLGSLALGAGILILLFMATQTAIECARSAKCI